MATEMGNTGLSVSEGVLLGHALVARVAEEKGIRSFFIKGPASVLQGLRSPKASTDVDVFVSPPDLDSLLQGLLDRGWHERPVDPDRLFPIHAVTIDHPAWPCCVDIHFRFPGMQNGAVVCFEVMWALTQDMVLAGHILKVPSAPLGIAILALHALRELKRPTSQQELDFLKELTRREGWEHAVWDVAVDVDAVAAMRPFLEDIMPPFSIHDWPAPSLEWRNRLRATEPGAVRLLALAQAPWRRKPGLLWRALLPSKETFLSVDVHADVTVGGRLALHSARWARFLRATPRMLRQHEPFWR